MLLAQPDCLDHQARLGQWGLLGLLVLELQAPPVLLALPELKDQRVQ